ncbi:unnamed protein product [Rhizophagus irregularis]|nr:unnamed protein product [Rhizophagus irregularis]
MYNNKAGIQNTSTDKLISKYNYFKNKFLIFTSKKILLTSWTTIFIKIYYDDINNEMEEIEENIGGRGRSRARSINV